VEDALRPFALQQQLHDELIPALLRKNHPGISGSELNDRLKDIMPYPRATRTGLRRTPPVALSTLPYASSKPPSVMWKGASYPWRLQDADTARTINPDYFEQFTPKTENRHLSPA